MGTASPTSDRAPRSPRTRSRIASISKTFTAIAVMRLWEQGLVDLDAPANDYLRAYRLIAAKATFRPATLRHLLTHTAGMTALRGLSDLLRPTLGWGVRVGGSVPSLAEYYRRGLRLEVEPGSKWVYGNHGPATLGQIVEDVSGEPFDSYLREHVFGPLGMEGTDLVRSERVRARLATGYVLRSRGLKGGHRPRDRDTGRRLRLLHHEGHGSLRRRSSGRRSQRARLGAQARDGRRHVRAPLRAGGRRPSVVQAMPSHNPWD